MGPAAILNILVTANTKAATAQLYKVQGQMEATEKKSHLLRNAAIGVSGAIGVSLAAAAKTGFNELKQAQKASAQTAAVLKSTGGAAHVTAKHVDELATALLKKSGIDDEAVKSGENMLLTFTKIRNETGKGNQIFDRATQAITDMATAMNHGVTPSAEQLSRTAIQVGKALQDPIKGATALRRVGVALTEDQQNQIKAFIKSGEQMKAQKLILHELNREFGGSAEAAGKTLPGQLDKLRETYRNLAATIMQRAAPAIASIAGALTKFLQGMQDGTGAGGKFAAAMRQIGQDLKPVLSALGKITKFLIDHPRLLEGAAAAFAVWRAAAAAAAVQAKAKLIATFLGLGPKAAAGGAIAGNAFGREASQATGKKMRGFGWGGLGRFAGPLFALGFVAAAEPIINKLTGGGLSGNDVITPTKQKIFDLQSKINRPGRGTQFPKLKKKPGAASGAFIAGPRGAGDIVPIWTKPGEVVLNAQQQAMIGRKRIFDVLSATGAQTIGPGGKAASGGLTAMMSTAGRIDSRHYPYRWGGGHNPSFSPPYDCSGAVSAVLHAGGVLDSPLVSGQLANWGLPGPGKVTIYANPVHTWMRIGGKAFGTSRSNPGGGAGWFAGNSPAGYSVRHVPENLLRLTGGMRGPGGADGTDKGVRPGKLTGKLVGTSKIIGGAIKGTNVAAGKARPSSKFDDFYQAALTNAQIKTPGDTSDDLKVLNAYRQYAMGQYGAAMASGNAQAIIDAGNRLSGIDSQISDLTSPIDAGTGEDPNQPLIDALNADAEAQKAAAEALAAVKDELKRQNDFATAVTTVSLGQAWKAMADVISGQIVGVGLNNRANTASSGSVVRY